MQKALGLRPCVLAQPSKYLPKIIIKWLRFKRRKIKPTQKRKFLYQKELGMEVPTCNPSTWEAEAGVCELDASLSYMTRPRLKTRSGEGKGHTQAGDKAEGVEHMT
jgi:hypothetical protein